MEILKQWIQMDTDQQYHTTTCYLQHTTKSINRKGIQCHVCVCLIDYLLFCPTYVASNTPASKGIELIQNVPDIIQPIVHSRIVVKSDNLVQILGPYTLGEQVKCVLFYLYFLIVHCSIHSCSKFATVHMSTVSLSCCYEQTVECIMI